MPYVAPVKDMLFVMNELAGLSDVVAYPSYPDAGADVDLAPAILEESAKFNQDVVAPLNWAGDQNPSSLKDGVVTTTQGLRTRLSNTLLQAGKARFIRRSLVDKVCQNSSQLLV